MKEITKTNFWLRGEVGWLFVKTKRWCLSLKAVRFDNRYTLVGFFGRGQEMGVFIVRYKELVRCSGDLLESFLPEWKKVKITGITLAEWPTKGDSSFGLARPLAEMLYQPKTPTRPAETELHYVLSISFIATPHAGWSGCLIFFFFIFLFVTLWHFNECSTSAPPFCAIAEFWATVYLQSTPLFK